MKRIAGFSLLIVVAAAVLLTRAAGEQLLGSLITVNNTTSNSVPVTVGTIAPPVQTVSVQTGGLGVGTNTLAVNCQVSIDGANWVTYKTYYMTTTNATTETFSTGSTNVALQFRVSATTTTNVQVSVSRQ